MNTDDEYRQQAAEAQAMADQSISAADKEAGLGIVQSWLALIRKPTELEKFDTNAKARGTGQEGSDSSN